MPRNPSRLCSIAALATAATLLALSTGCSSKVTSGDIRSNPSPELYSTAKTHEEHRNDVAQVVDWNVRSMRDDWNRLLLLERGSRLTLYPAP
ncbi:MAG: hypothetical protein AAF750_07115 [Planctomycetota bacterium]